MSKEPLRVGIVGAGPVSQAIHLPALASLPADFTITHVVDIAADTAAEVARRAGSRWSTSLDELLADPEVDVVAICSPHHLHAEQVIAAFRAGKKGVLCEKPLAVSAAEAQEIAEAARHYNSHLVVGSMHKYDPGWIAAIADWQRRDETAHTIRSTIVLPPNARFEDFSADIISRPPPPPRRGDTVDERAGSVERSVLGLAVHDLPLIRMLAGGATKPVIRWAEPLRPLGYRLVFTLGDTTVDLLARIHPTWKPDWSLEAISKKAQLRAQFTPSYVVAGSAEAQLCAEGSPTTSYEPQPTNGYQGEWQHLAALVRQEIPADDPRELINDLDLTLELAAAGAQWVRDHDSSYVPTEARS